MQYFGGHLETEDSMTYGPKSNQFVSSEVCAKCVKFHGCGSNTFVSIAVTKILDGKMERKTDGVIECQTPITDL